MTVVYGTRREQESERDIIPTIIVVSYINRFPCRTVEGSCCILAEDGRSRPCASEGDEEDEDEGS